MIRESRDKYESIGMFYAAFILLFAAIGIVAGAYVGLRYQSWILVSVTVIACLLVGASFGMFAHAILAKK
ncbi:MAG: hypothetical protein LBQ43_03080 [Holosporales bacterium]|jgi:hypothetical protein|nr:hypothetical protein [Holosporales bacterium]